MEVTVTCARKAATAGEAGSASSRRSVHQARKIAKSVPWARRVAADFFGVGIPAGAFGIDRGDRGALVSCGKW